MKLMDIYEIEKLHELHKRKLSNINSTNHKQKAYQSIVTNLEKINNYRRKKIYTETFIEK